MYIIVGTKPIHLNMYNTALKILRKNVDFYCSTLLSNDCLQSNDKNLPNMKDTNNRENIFITS